MPIQQVKTKSGLTLLMERVVEECDEASVAFAPDPVHDLRVVLRRCCSIADGIRAVDPDPAWREMKKAGKRLFRKLGELRDLHVMQDWIHLLDTPGDPVTGPLLELVHTREGPQQQEAFQALQDFDRKQWQRWARSLPGRMARLRQGSLIFRHLALERWTEAYRLHRLILRRPSSEGLHRLRIGVKRFRYIVENFLPLQHGAWIADLKHTQDLLGDVHDLDVLGTLIEQASIFPDIVTRARWLQRIHEERASRIEAYEKKTTGKDSLWESWREGLPNREEVGTGAWLRLKLWASLLDPDFKHSVHVSRLALQIYDGLAASQPTKERRQPRDRRVLEIAALLHDVGRSKDGKGHHKKSFRMIRQMAPPLGCRKQDLLTAAIVARYHRGALPVARQRTLTDLGASERKDISRLAAILRLAAAFDSLRDGRIQRVQIKDQGDILVIAAQGYSSRDRTAEAIAAARHLLEVVYRRPVMVKTMRVATARRASSNRPKEWKQRTLKTESGIHKLAAAS